jgi:hypothetical protein
MKCIIIPGLLTHLSDNIIPFLDKETDVFVYTWDTQENGKWGIKLNRYKKYCNNLYYVTEKPRFEKKLHSYFYSTYKTINLIQDIYKYETIVKFKPNVEGDITYVGDLEYYFKKGFLQSRPLLEGITKEECIYGSIYYQTMDERIFSGYPLGFSKMFHILEQEFIRQMINLDNRCMDKYGYDYEGSIFWKEWAEDKGVKLIQDLDLKIPNSIQWQR